MLDVKRVLKAAPTKMRSQEPLQQLWTPWGEQIAGEWLSSNDAHKAFCPAKDGERKLENGRTPILNEHPRPTMVRGNHTMLNGFWDYAIVSIPESGNGSKWRKSAAVLTRDEAVQAVKEAAIPETFDGKILVPFSPESALSGVHQTIYPDNMIWYRTVVHPVTLGGGEAVRQIGDANRLMLHFEAVDYVCACFINGQFAGMHVGGYLPFDVDISAFVDPDDAFEIALCVYDPNDSGTQMRGKQKIEREGIWYTAQSGIWQSVWMEIVPEAYVQTLTLKGAADGRLFIRAEIGGDKPNAKLHIVVADPADGTIVADELLPAGMRKVRTEIATRAEHLWSPNDPYLYDVTATLEFGAAKSQGKQEKLQQESQEIQEKPAKSQEKQDIVRSYCAFRTVEIKPDLKGIARFHLNGKPVFLKGVLDQGYWPDGLLTAPSDEALVHDITAMKEWLYYAAQAYQNRVGALVLPLRPPRHAGMAGRGVGWRRIQRVGHQPQADAHACHMEQVPRRHGEAFRGARCRRFDVPPRLVAHLRCHGAHACRPPVDRHVGAVQRRVGAVRRVRCGGTHSCA